MAAPWDQTFETELRRQLPGLSADAELTPQAPLAAYGLDSLATIALIARLEDAYGVRLPDEAIAPEHFRTAATAWTLISRLTAATATGTATVTERGR
ncbi:MAG: acyl carrier protein [Catenulispora sp.]|nr:acyl carrier protein [Catenulispora sp.]